jgi:DNA repair exonuclease SbcCD nuclease subunit
MVRFIHTSDWQLGMRRHFLSAEAQPRFSADRINAITTIGRIAADRGCAFAVVAGDVFEHNAIDRQTVVRALDAMAATRLPFYLLPGNHDPLNDASVYRSPTFLERKPGNVTVLQSAEPIEAAPGIEIAAAPWSSKHPVHDLVAEAIRKLEPTSSALRILVGHGTPEEKGGDSLAIIDLATVERALESNTIAYAALGDMHSVNAYGSSGRIWHSGAPEPTAYVEREPGHILVVDLEPGRCNVEKVPIARWRFIERKFPLNGGEDIAGLDRWLESLPDKPNTILKLSFEGTLHLIDNLKLEEVLDHAATLFGALERWERHMDLAIVSDESDFGHLGLSGFAASVLHELQTAAASSGAEAETANDAMALLFRLAGGVA